MTTVTVSEPAKEHMMEVLLRDSPPLLRVTPGEIVEGTVVFKGKNKLLLDLQNVATGIISGRELRDSFGTFKNTKLGDALTTLVLEEENDEGLVVLSLRMASQLRAWERLYSLTEEEETMEFAPQEVNKGGLLANIDGIRTFLPLSQLSPMHYPRVSNGDTGEIMTRLKKLIGHTFLVKVITMDEEAGKIVVSEREALSEQRSRTLENLKMGDVREGIISGIVDFGLFVTFDGLEGLIHISEIAWGHVRDPAEFAAVGDRVKVKIIGIDDREKLSLSIKQLTRDPWEEVAERYPVGKRVQGVVMRFTEYGAFVQMERDINGLIHLTEIAHEKVTDPSEALKIGQKIQAQVINVDPEERRIGLSRKAILPIDKETLERLKKEKEEEEKKAETKKAETKPPVAKKEVTGSWVASKSGKKYYAADSAQGKKIKEENRVYFASQEEAEKAGYKK